MRESTPNKKLVLIYLANEITQTSKMRKKEEFLRAYEPLIAEATAIAYRGSPVEIQNKIRRVVEVWRARQIFSLPVQQDVEKQIDGETIRMNRGEDLADAIQNLTEQKPLANLPLVVHCFRAHQYRLSSHRSHP